MPSKSKIRPSIDKQSIRSLRYSSRRKHPVHRLPFVDGSWKVKHCRWAVPKRGGFTGGHETGSALALMYMKHLRETKGNRFERSLRTIVLDMFDFPEGELSPEEDSLRGQVCGFFQVIDDWLATVAVHLDEGSVLDQEDKQKLVKAANAGLDFDEIAYMETLQGLSAAAGEANQEEIS